MREKIRAYKTNKEVIRIRLSKGHDKSGTRGRRKSYFTIHCEIHGKYRPGGIEKVVLVPPIYGRPAKKAGCPYCKKESK